MQDNCNNCDGKIERIKIDIWYAEVGVEAILKGEQYDVDSPRITTGFINCGK